ncbi:MAG: hypothetical protein ACKOD2_02960, partial [Ilumatobacteraceae bacterium]
VSGSTLTPGDAGSSCVVRATRASDDDYLETDSADTTVTVGKASQATLTVTSTNATYDDTLTLTSSGGSGTGAVSWTKVSGTCTVSGSTLTPGDAGSSCVVRATKASDTNHFSINSANTTVTVNKASQTGLTISNALSFTTGTPLSLTATGGQSTGSLSWSVTTGTCTLSGTSLSAARGGLSCTVEVTRAGDSNYLARSVSETITVNKIAQTLTFRSTPPSPANPGGTYTVAVDSDAFLAPVIAIANSSSAVCSVSAGIVTFNTSGTCLISASQSGNDVYAAGAASQSVTVTAIAAAAPQTTAPAVSAPVVPATVPQSSVPVEPAASTTTTTSTTVPARDSSGSAPTTTTTSTTTTTTTTVPADPTLPQTGPDGKASELAAGETIALVRGELVKVTVEQVEETLVVTLPNDVKIVFGRSSKDSTSVAVAADGVLRMFRDDEVEITVSGLVPGTVYTVYMFSEPFELGRGVADANGVVSTSVRVPTDAAHGEHTIQFNGVGPGGEVVTTSMGFEVLERRSNTRMVVLAMTLAILLALLGGRPIFAGRRRRRA